MTKTQVIENIFNNWSDAQKFSGVISVSNDDGVIYEKVQGFRNIEEQLPNEADTMFGIASGGKLFTAVAICQLIDQGKLALDSRVCDVLPHNLGTIDKEITVLHLLTHTSGVSDYFDVIDDDNEEASTADFFVKYPVHTLTTIEAYLPLFIELPSKFKAGEKAEYSNSNFILLGLVIEAISGEKYHDYMEGHIFKPLNLTRTGFYKTNRLPYNTAIGYIWEAESDDYDVANTFWLPVIGASDGGLYTCGADMAAFWKGIFSKQLFSEDMLRQFLAMRSQEGDDHFCLGVIANKMDQGMIYYHDGADWGVRFHSVYFPKTKITATFFANRGGIKVRGFMNELIPLLIANPEDMTITDKVILESSQLIKKSGLPYAICGGFAIDMFLNRATRRHTDFDITIFEEDRKAIFSFMLSQGWRIYDHVWDGAGTDYLVGINSPEDERALTVPCVWAVTPDCTLVTIEPKDAENNIFTWKMASGEHTNCDFIEICFDGKENDSFICSKENNISRPLDKAILYRAGVPYLAPEVVLYHKSASAYMTWKKTVTDFDNTAPLLSDEARDWLIQALKATYPDGHEWVTRLENLN